MLFLETSEEMPSAEYGWRVMTSIGEREILESCNALLVPSGSTAEVDAAALLVTFR